MKAKEKSWSKALFAYAEGEKKKLGLSVILSVLSVLLSLAPFYCMYEIICLFAEGAITAQAVVYWCAWALAAYIVYGVLHFGRAQAALDGTLFACAFGRSRAALHRRNQKYDGR